MIRILFERALISDSRGRHRRFAPSTLLVLATLLACGGLNDNNVGTSANSSSGSRVSGSPNAAIGGATGSGSALFTAGAATGGSAGYASGGLAMAAGGAPSNGGSAGTTVVPPQHLLGAPLVFSPTSYSFGVSVVATDGDPSQLGLRARRLGAATYGDLQAPQVPAPDLAQWTLNGLMADSRYEYEIVSKRLGGETVLYQGSAQTQRTAGQAFTFALLSDSHIGSDLDFSNQGIPSVMAAVTDAIHATAPDFMIHLGDLLDYHEYGFGVPPPDSSIARLAYLNYRGLLGDAAANAAHFLVIGNWDGENGAFTNEEIVRSRSQRLLYVPGPSDATYAEGGSPVEDYYAFTWGDALFIVLNVMTYTLTDHLLSYDPGLPDDWTLGAQQLDWLSKTLSNAHSKWRFLFIHHTVGGAAGDDADSAYGRGGGQAAHVGEQATVHQLMIDNGVQVFFYGHDHVFTDMVVDGIHYSLPGSAGAPWTFTTAETGYTQYWPDSGWARVDVAPESVHVQFISMNGQVLYEYTLH